MESMITCEKVYITVNEAAEIAGIGRNKIREISDDPNCKFVLWNGAKRLLHREKLLEYLDTQKNI